MCMLADLVQTNRMHNASDISENGLGWIAFGRVPIRTNLS